MNDTLETQAPLMQADRLTRHYTSTSGPFAPKATVRALEGISFELHPARTLAVVGESGCGKSTLARQVTFIETPTSGSIRLDGKAVALSDRAALKQARAQVQIIFQDPYGSLNPRKKVRAILEEPLIINSRMSAAKRRERVDWMMQKVGLRPEFGVRYPHMFSGGQRQRIAIARALMLNPKVVVADEPVSALDVSVQAQVLNLLMDLEVGTKQTLFDTPLHPYTRALMAATPHIDPAARKVRMAVKGELPSPLDPPSGCAFHTRCPYAIDRCKSERPELRVVQQRQIACHRAEEVPALEAAQARD